MPGSCDKFEIMISGCVDGEISEEDRQRLDTHLAGCTACTRELDHMKRIVAGTDHAMAVDEPPPEVWDTFLDGVYNRVERQSGWILLIVGVVALTAVGITLFAMSPEFSDLTKVLVSVPVAGLVILFLSVLRQRMRVAKTDRYSKEVLR